MPEGLQKNSAARERLALLPAELLRRIQGVKSAFSLRRGAVPQVTEPPTSSATINPSVRELGDEVSKTRTPADYFKEIANERFRPDVKVRSEITPDNQLIGINVSKGSDDGRGNYHEVTIDASDSGITITLKDHYDNGQTVVTQHNMFPRYVSGHVYITDGGRPPMPGSSKVLYQAKIEQGDEFVNATNSFDEAYQTAMTKIVEPTNREEN